MTLESDIARLKAQEEALQFERFDEADAWALGQSLRELAMERKLPLVIDIRVAGRQLFYTALAATSPDNAEWVRRKINVVMRFHKSSYLVGRELALKGEPLSEARGVLVIDHAPNGGCFPIRIRNVGVVGTVTVSGIPQRQDHGFVAEGIARFLGLDGKALALPDAEG
jgi:uncharacterized protein (UPF0303 family)